LVLSGIGQTDLILGYDFIQEEGMIIDGAANETYFADPGALRVHTVVLKEGSGDIR
jgi:hypothetical protein